MPVGEKEWALYSLNKRARFRVLQGKAVVVHLEKGEVIGLNKTGTAVLKAIVDGDSLDDAKLALEKSGASKQTIEDDVSAFLNALLDQKVLEKSE